MKYSKRCRLQIVSQLLVIVRFHFVIRSQRGEGIWTNRWVSHVRSVGPFKKTKKVTNWPFFFHVESSLPKKLPDTRVKKLESFPSSCVTHPDWNVPTSTCRDERKPVVIIFSNNNPEKKKKETDEQEKR